MTTTTHNKTFIDDEEEIGDQPASDEVDPSLQMQKSIHDFENGSFFQIPDLLETLQRRLLSCASVMMLNDNNKHHRRSNFKELLLQAYHRGINKDREEEKPEFVLISGPSGSGKTHLAKTLGTVVTDDDYGGTFLIGKFDPLQRHEPYRAFVTAFTDFATLLIDSVEQQDNNKLSSLQHAILEAVGEGTVALTDMIPALKRVIGQQQLQQQQQQQQQLQDRPTSTALKNGVGAMSHFVFVFRMFVRAVCSAKNPLVFVLDDLQWADPCSLDLLLSLVTDIESRGCVLFVGTYNEDDDAVVVSATKDSNSPFSTMLAKLEEANVQISNFVLSNLSYDEVMEAVDGMFDTPAALAEAVFLETKGNICYMIEFFRWLLEEDLVEFNQTRMQWEWEPQVISLAFKHHNSIHDFMVNRLEQLIIVPNNTDVQEVLKVASCLGSVVNEDLVRHVVDFDVTAALDELIKRGIFVRNRQTSSSRAYFAHNVAQKAAYALIKPDDRSGFHLKIGRKLWQCLEEPILSDNVFTILSQYCMSGTLLVDDEEEKVAIASLCLHAGRKAAKSSTFRIASVYLNFGIKLLMGGDDGWNERYYDLSMELHNAAAEMELCTANFERMNELLDAVFANARPSSSSSSSHDTLQASATRIYSLGVRDQQQQAILEAKNTLWQLIGETFPNRLLRVHLATQMISIKWLLRGKSDAMLMRLPLMEDPNMLAAIRILDLMFLSAFITTPLFAMFVALKMMKITLQHGSSAWTATAFSSYGTLCCSAGQSSQGYRFGQLALAYLQKFQCREFLPRVYFGVYGCIHSWKRPVMDALEPLHYAHRVGLETGDFEFSFLNSHMFCLCSIQAGVPLGQIEKDVKGFTKLMAAKNHKSTLQFAMVFLQTIHDLMGLSDDPLSVTGEIVDYGKALDHANQTDNVTYKMAILTQRSAVAYLFGAYDLANELTEERRQFRFQSGHDEFVLNLFGGLIAAAVARQHKHQRRKQLWILQANIQKLTKWVRLSPSNCLDKLFLLEAEQASIRGDHELACQKYTCANALASDSKCLWVQAIANERAGEHMLRNNEAGLAARFFRRACDLFEEWGAHAKVQRLIIMQASLMVA